jgi:hypothetical protein
MDRNGDRDLPPLVPERQMTATLSILDESL